MQVDHCKQYIYIVNSISTLYILTSYVSMLYTCINLKMIDNQMYRGYRLSFKLTSHLAIYMASDDSDMFLDKNNSIFTLSAMRLGDYP